MSHKNSESMTLLCSGDRPDLAQPIKVSELVSILKADVEQKHRFVRVIGEVSSFKEWRSGHCYFDIKDDQALMPAVMFRPHFQKVPFAVADGLLVLFSGRLSIYPANSRLQMIVEAMEPLGQGALMLAFEQLKERLKAEGLFEEKHKKTVRSFNSCIGLITSSHGAVLRDMVRILKNRMPKVDILFSPVRVQGAGAAVEIANAIRLLDSTQSCDVIIVGRGGGSLEDLWAFNEEIVARAIFKAKTPIISAVGHETDTTISDFVADVRAATPTHAAVMVVPEERDILNHLSQALIALRQRNHAAIRKNFLQLAETKRRLKDPRILLFRHWQRVDDSAKVLNERFGRAFRQKREYLDLLKSALFKLAPFRSLRLKREALFNNKSALISRSPQNALGKARFLLKNTQNLLHEHIKQDLTYKRQQFSQYLVTLEALSPLRVLSRGYSIVEAHDTKRILNKVSHFYSEQQVTIRVEDGSVSAVITKRTRCESFCRHRHGEEAEPTWPSRS